MKDLFKYIFILTIILFSSLGCQKKDVVPKHIFFIVIDTLRADHLGCYGYKAPISPTIDRLAKEGVLFENVFSTASTTLESVFSFFTSNINLGNQIYNKDLLKNYPLFQKSLISAGYNPLAIVSNPWLKTRSYIFKDGFAHMKFVISDSWAQSGMQNTTDEVTDAVLNFLETKFNPNGKNFFYVHYLDPHDPYISPVDYNFFPGIVPESFVGVYALSGEEEVYNRYKKDSTYTGIPTPKHVTENELNYLISKYDTEIRHVDFNLDKLLTRLQEMNILEDSLIIITADHGEEFLEHGCFRHGYQLYDETIHIPLIFYWKDHLKAERKKNLVSGIDIPPTILNLCQINAPSSMLGSNILSGKRKEPILFCTHCKNQDQRGMRTNKWKLIHNVRTDEIKIFNLENDPQEKNNLFDGDVNNWKHILSTFEKLLEKHIPQDYEEKEENLEIDPETKEQLKALGYL